ncbi:MAG: ABC transporter ATP-binding protein [Firmicutes bacterium]|jgi:zinc transport system ATP-binding protein|nr:ABC transporter ATP-binding protein [Bacillota bacterium]MDD3298361.1 ABC transporter ATP-binding protein [Bacillota bacterium]MDD3851211.1 ABC transporter ATP-binding protein [Bacillota bacterium]MDD4707546.1 ABC transporter ATP-binding protein [Bacillota bacterium]
MNTERLVRIKNVYFEYGKEPVLINVSLDIAKGDYLGVVGPNGSGKSTLIKLILGILKPSGGSIELFGKNIEDFDDWEQIGYVKQKAASFNPGFPATVEEVVGANLYPGKNAPKPGAKKLRERVNEVLSIVKMDKYGRKLIGNLSGGQQQRIFIARALINSPQILLLDEPTIGIDLDSQREFYSLLERLNRKMRITIMMVSHDIGVITQRAGRVVCMGDGKLICHPNNSRSEISGILKKVYGNTMDLIIHDH